MDLFHDQREDLFASNLAERRNEVLKTNVFIVDRIEVGRETLANENFLDNNVEESCKIPSRRSS